MKVFLVTSYAVVTSHTRIIGIASTFEKAKDMATHQYPVKDEWFRVVNGAWTNRFDISGNIHVSIERLEVDELALFQHSSKG